MRPIDDIVRDAAIRVGLYVSRTTPETEVLSVLAQLWPTYDPSHLTRYGGNSDGGYLMPDDLTGVVACVSPGVADAVSFEVDLAEVGIESLMVDGSIDRLPHPVPGATFLPRYVGARTEADVVALSDLFAASPEGDLILQLDIEGAEYQVLAATPSAVLERARIIVVELHDLYNVFEPTTGPLMLDVLRRLLRTHGVAHVHANNMDGFLTVAGRVVPRALEVTFVRHDHMITSATQVTLPHPLDRPCCPDRPDIVPVLHPT